MVKKYKDVKNIKNSPAHKGGYVNQIHTLIDKKQDKKKATTLYLPTSSKVGFITIIVY